MSLERGKPRKWVGGKSSLQIWVNSRDQENLFRLEAGVRFG